MSNKEAEAIIQILLKADSGCESCVENLLYHFNAVFGFTQLCEKYFRKEFNQEINWENLKLRHLEIDDG